MFLNPGFKLDEFAICRVLPTDTIPNTRVSIKFDKSRELDNLDRKIYTKKDFIKFHEDFSKVHLKLYQYNKDRIFLHDLNTDIVFIPLSDKTKNIVDYSYIDYKHLELLKDVTCRRCVTAIGKKYAICGQKVQQVHHVIHGAKPPKCRLNFV